MLDGEEHEASAADEIEDEVIVYDELAKSLARLEAMAQLFHKGLGFSGSHRMGEEGPAGFGKPA